MNQHLLLACAVAALPGSALLGQGPRPGLTTVAYGTADLAPPKYEHQAIIRIENGKRIIDSNGIPDHDVGQFPRRGNPNSIAPQNYHLEMPLEPKIAERPSSLVMQAFGIA